METRNFTIIGQVLEASTGAPVANLKVEAWDKDTKYHDLLGIGATNGEGRFEIDFDSSYFGLDDRKGAPDIFFKIWLGRKFLLNTEAKPLANSGEKTEVTLHVGLPAHRPEGKDRVSTEQALKATAFFRDSDFVGVFSDFQKKTGTSLGFLSDMVTNTVSKFDWKPVRGGNVKEEDVVGKDTGAVRESLRSHQVEVADVQPYNPKLNAASLQNIRALPTNLKPGQRVRLFEENGKVRYYALMKEEATSSPTNTGTGTSTGGSAGDELGIQKMELSRLREDLSQTKQLVAERDERISKLQEELNGIRKEQDEFRGVLKSDAFIKLLKDGNTGVIRRSPKPKQ